MRYIIDVDGTICTQTQNGEYHKARPYIDRIAHLNKLYDEGHSINYWTARGGTTGKDHKELTIRQLKEWGVKYHTFNDKKPVYDLWVDDKAMNSEVFFNDIGNRT